MKSIACSLHIMDVRLLKMLIPALHEGVLPDMKAEVADRAHRDILLNWSRKIINAAAPLADTVSPSRWQLYTQYRPLFITADDPEKAVELTHRLFHAPQLEGVFDFFREEIARLDPDQADEIIDSVRQDNSPGVLPFQSVEEIAENFRTYLLYHRRALQALMSDADGGSLSEEMLMKTGRRLPWCLCQFMANIYPNWYISSSSFTFLDFRGDLGWDNVIADPRGMFARFSQRIPGLHDHLPIKLNEHHHTGLCIPPSEVGRALSFLMAELEQPMPPHPKFGALVHEELQAIQEALLYAMIHKAGVWEATGMHDPSRNLFPQILGNQGEREDHLVHSSSIKEPTTTTIDSEQQLQQDADTWREQKITHLGKDHVVIKEDTAGKPSSHTEEEYSWFIKLLKTKVF
jgi:hypothetical protein